MATRSELSLTLWTAWVFLATMGMLELQDVLTASMTHVPDILATFLWRTALFVVPAAMGIAIGFGALRSPQHALISVCALALGWYTITSFRGLWIREGTLDDWQMRGFFWMRCLVPSFFVGSGVGYVLGRKPSRALSVRHVGVAFGAFVGLALLSTALLFLWPLESVFPPTRPLALGATTLLTLGLLIAEARDA